ncbi:sigma-70 family RNA polymerase sigma factor, partial [Sphingobacterium shayense]|uniref:RNA polymerase sigma factor n=1 Tax=Sphingobacterium shayense TaxID=626343 RepID=UPI001551A766
MDNTCEVQLLNDIKSGDHVAFKKVIDLYADALFIYVERRINSREDSQEIVQDIFCSLWKNCKKITIQDSLGPYLYKAAKFEIIDWIRSNNRSQTKLKDLAYHLPNANESIEEQFIANEL